MMSVDHFHYELEPTLRYAEGSPKHSLRLEGAIRTREFRNKRVGVEVVSTDTAPRYMMNLTGEMLGDKPVVYEGSGRLSFAADHVIAHENCGFHFKLHCSPVVFRKVLGMIREGVVHEALRSGLRIYIRDPNPDSCKTFWQTAWQDSQWAVEKWYAYLTGCRPSAAEL